MTKAIKKAAIIPFVFASFFSFLAVGGTTSAEQSASNPTPTGSAWPGPL